MNITNFHLAHLYPAKSPLSRCMLALAILTLLPWAGMALNPSESAFVWNQAQSVMRTAGTTNDYIQAARLYQQLIDGGVRDGTVFYNLGTALLKAGRYDDALEALERAERRLGAQADIRRNMGIALARKQKGDTAAWPWHRVPLFWHFSITWPIRIWIATGAFSLFWILAGLRRLGWRHTGAPLVLALLTFILFGSSALTTAWQEWTAKPCLLDLPLTQESTVLHEIMPVHSEASHVPIDGDMGFMNENVHAYVNMNEE